MSLLKVLKAEPFGALALSVCLFLGSALPAQADSLSVAPMKGQVLASADANDDPTSELMRQRAELQKAYESLNALNPLSQDYGKSQGKAPEPGSPFEQIQKLLSNPAVQGYLRFFTNPVFSQSVEKIWNSPRRMNLLYAELGLMLFMLVFRAWRFSKSTHWARKLWTNAWTFCLYWVSALVIVPWAVMGTPYYHVLSGALEVLMRTASGQ